MIRRIEREERGAFLVVWVLLMTAMLTMVAIVIDLGQLRDTRRQTQRTADLAAIASGRDMAGGSIIRACRSAIKYVKDNTRDMSALGETCSSTFALACDPSSPRSMIIPSGPYVVTIRNPIPNAEIEDPSYPVNALTGTRTLDADGKPCERMRVTVQRTNSALFARVAGTSSFTTKGTAVIRGFVGKLPKQSAGLVTLERKSCDVIETSGQGSVVVKGLIAADGTPRPGIIQVDSRALEGNPNCFGGNVPNHFVVFGTKLPSGADRPGEPSIVAQPISGSPGRLDLFLLTDDPLNGHTAYDVAGGGVSPGPTPGVIASRQVVDDVYNAPSGSGSVSKLKADSNTLLTNLQNAATACPTCNVLLPPAGPPCTAPNYFVYPPGTPGGADSNGCLPLTPSSGLAECSNSSATLVDVAATYDKVFVNCPSGLSVKRVRFLGTKFVLAGKLDVGSGNSALFPNAQELIIKGCVLCTGGDKGINVAGSLIVNSGPTTPLAKQCDDNLDNDSDGTTDEFNAVSGTGDAGCQTVSGWDEISCPTDRDGAAVRPNRIVLLSGPIETSASSEVEFCQTFVLLADGANLPDLDTAAATDFTCAGNTDISGTFIPQPCPKNNSYKGSVKIKGDIDWSAPNQTAGIRDTALPLQYFEDLAVWTETSDPSEIGGPGATVTSGVFFFPNARTEFSGQASQHIDLNAQYIARKLALSGQGTLSMTPNPNDVVETPAPYFKLIR